MAFDDLYQEIILDHYRNPRNAADLDHVSAENVHENPSCGDSVKLEVVENGNGTIEKIRFDGQGCAISVASASMMSELVAGKTRKEAMEMILSFQRVMRGEDPVTVLEAWGDVAALQGVIRYPLRVKCATLAWHALKDSLAHGSESE